jgi:hypothetical protein
MTAEHPPATNAYLPCWNCGRRVETSMLVWHYQVREGPPPVCARCKSRGVPEAPLVLGLAVKRAFPTVPAIRELLSKHGRGFLAALDAALATVPLEDISAAAGRVKLRFGEHKGQTIAQVGQNQEGRHYLQWALTHYNRMDDWFRERIELFLVPVRLVRPSKRRPRRRLRRTVNQLLAIWSHATPEDQQTFLDRAGLRRARR